MNTMIRRVLMGGVFAAAFAAATISNVDGRPAEEFGKSLSGSVVWSGALPEVKELNVTKDQQHCLGKGKIFSEEYVVDKDSKTVANVYVWLEPMTKGGKMPLHASNKDITEKEVAIDQPICAFVPHALALREGQTLLVKNTAPIAHNVKWTGGLKNPGSNVIVASEKEVKVTNLKAEAKPVAVACNIHPWMNAWIRVFDHPYFAVTGKDGKFEIKNPPAGDYKLFVWQEGAGFKNKDGDKITIKAGDTTDAGKLEIKKGS